MELRFNFKDKVKIIPLATLGRVIAIWMGERGVQYQVRYFDNAEAKTVYFYDDELESLPTPE